MSKIDPASDKMTAVGAANLAQTIETFWHSRGHLDVKVDVVRMVVDGEASKSGTHGTISAVRSNLRGGLPPTTKPVPVPQKRRQAIRGR